MGKGLFEDIAPFAALAALPVLAPGATGAAGTGILGTTPYAAPAMGAFGSESMMATGAAGGLLGGQAAGAAAASEALPALNDPLIENGLWDGVGKIPNQIESAGVDFINGVPQNFGARVEQFANNLFDGGFKPDSLFKMGTPQEQPKQQRPAAIMSQIKPVGRNAQPSAPQEPMYSQPVSPRQPTQEELQQIQMLRAMGRI